VIRLLIPLVRGQTSMHAGVDGARVRKSAGLRLKNAMVQYARVEKEVERGIGWEELSPESSRALHGVVQVLESILADALPSVQDFSVPQHKSREQGEARESKKKGEEVVAGAAYTLAVLLEEGRGAPMNRGRAAFLYSFAARAGLLSAQYNLGMMLLNDPPPNALRLLPRDEHLFPVGSRKRSAPKAPGRGRWTWPWSWQIWHQVGSAQAQGATVDSKAPGQQGYCAVPTSMDLPLEMRVNRWAGALLLEAAKQGHVLAMHNLGVLLANGEAPGLLKDEEMAEVLFQAASDKAHTPSTKTLAALRRNDTAKAVFTFGGLILVAVVLVQLLVIFVYEPWEESALGP